MNKKISPREYLPLLILLLLTALVAVALILRPEPPEVKTEYFSDYFDTVSSVSDYSGGEDFDSVAALVEKRLSEYHELFDIYSEREEVRGVAYLNANAGGSAVALDTRVIELLLYSKEIYTLTSGEVNIMMGSVLSLWHDCREGGGRVPTAAELSSRAEHTSIDSLVIDKEQSTARITDPEASVDVGAIAKGYAVEMIRRELEGLGYSGIVLDIGGNLSIVGNKPDGGGWRTGIINPDRSSDERYIHYLDVADTSVVTSGDYERYYELDGVRYHHLIDKDTLMPARFFASVTVITKNSALADALSTALFLMDLESGRALVDSLDGVDAVWVESDGAVTLSD